MDIPALQIGRQQSEQVTELLLLLLLLFGKLPGTHQPLKAPVLRHNREIHQFEAAGQDNRQKAPTQQCKRACTHHGDPVVLQMEGFFYKVDFVLWRRSTELIVIRHALEVGGRHLDTHPDLSAARSLAQTTENVVRQLVKLVSLLQAQVAGAVEGHLNVFDNRSRMRTHNKDSIRQVNRLVNVVRDEQDRAGGFVPYFQQQLLHFAAGLRVERPERFVHQDNGGTKRQGACNGNALLHAPGERLRIGVFKAAKSNILD